MLKKLDKNTITQITSNISIPSIPDIIKELVDNSIDAKSRAIRVEIKDGGLSQILVTDNGTGIPSSHFDSLCQRGTTSKLGDFSDVFKISTFGFRGQALSAICFLCDITLITKTKNSQTFIVNFNNDGTVSNKNILNDEEIFYVQRKIWRDSGTIFLIKNLYKNNKLRQEILSKKHENFITEITNLIQSYAIINTQIKFDFFSEEKGKFKNILSTNENDTILTRIFTIFGKNFAEKLTNIKFENDFVCVDAFVTKDILSGSKYNKAKSTRMFFVNKRKIDAIKNLENIFLNIYKKYNKDANPSWIVSLTLPEGSFDINLGEKKNEVVFKFPEKIFDFVEKNIENFHEERMKLLMNNEKSEFHNENIEKFLNEKINDNNNNNNNNFNNKNKRNENEFENENLEKSDLFIDKENKILKLDENKIQKEKDEIDELMKFSDKSNLSNSFNNEIIENNNNFKDNQLENISEEEENVFKTPLNFNKNSKFNFKDFNNNNNFSENNFMDIEDDIQINKTDFKNKKLHFIKNLNKSYNKDNNNNNKSFNKSINKKLLYLKN